MRLSGFHGVNLNICDDYMVDLYSPQSTMQDQRHDLEASAVHALFLEGSDHPLGHPALLQEGKRGMENVLRAKPLAPMLHLGRVQVIRQTGLG